MATEETFRTVPLTPESQQSKAFDDASDEATRPKPFAWKLRFRSSSTLMSNLTIAEYTATFCYVYLSISSLIAVGMSVDARLGGTSALLAASMSNGLALSVGIAVGTSQGVGHCNPVVTVAYLLTGRIGLLRALLLVLAQLAGALSAAGVALAAFPEALSSNRLYIHSPQRAIILEAISASILVAATMSLRAKKEPQNPAAPVILGFFIASNMMGTSFFGDGAVNPARSLAIAITTSRWARSWVTILPPFIGSVFGALFYELLIESPDA